MKLIIDSWTVCLQERAQVKNWFTFQKPQKNTITFWFVNTFKFRFHYKVVYTYLFIIFVLTKLNCVHFLTICSEICLICMYFLWLKPFLMMANYVLRHVRIINMTCAFFRHEFLPLSLSTNHLCYLFSSRKNILKCINL